MSRNICVVQDFLNDRHKEQIRKAAEAAGFSVRFFTSQEQEDAVAYLQECEVLYARWPEVLRAAPKTLQWYCCSLAGVDIYCSDPTLFANPDCMLTNSNVYGVTIAEHTVMVTLMLLRRMPEYEDAVRRRHWPEQLPIRSIRDGSFTILGTGDIGRNVADRLRGMGARSITGVSRSGRADNAFDRVFPIEQLDEVLPQAGFLILALPGTAETFHILDRRRLALLPQGAYVVNVGRGTAIQQDAIIDALNSGALAGAALDVMVPEPLPAEDPLWGAKNLILTPHVSGNMTLGYTCDRNVDLFCEDLANYAAGRPLKALVDRSRGY
ncbi:MAG: D-2-hydroxyacid dehydrogenase [Oscillibacter sp.]|nr:D-2-hydroxyacid dehydrogenase [Oscillibacter sp.]